MKCEEFRSEVQGEIDRSGEERLSTALRDHVEMCGECRTFFESLIAVHRALGRLPRVSPSAELVTALNQIEKPVYVPMKLSWGPDIRLAAAMVAPVVLPFIAQILSLTVLQQVLEISILFLGATLFALAVLKPSFLGGPEHRIVLDKP
jgi:hypothetical protein